MTQRRASTAGIVSTALVALLLAACGHKGPLYVPGVPKQAAWPFPAPAAKPEAERRVPDVPATSEPDR